MKVGEVVQLKSGGPVMTVIAVGPTEDRKRFGRQILAGSAACSWWVSKHSVRDNMIGDYKTTVLPIEALTTEISK